MNFKGKILQHKTYIRLTYQLQKQDRHATLATQKAFLSERNNHFLRAHTSLVSNGYMRYLRTPEVKRHAVVDLKVEHSYLEIKVVRSFVYKICKVLETKDGNILPVSKCIKHSKFFEMISLEHPNFSRKVNKPLMAISQKISCHFQKNSMSQQEKKNCYL